MTKLGSTALSLDMSDLFDAHDMWYVHQRYKHRVLQTIQMKLILLCVWAEWAVLGSAKTALKFEYEIQIG